MTILLGALGVVLILIVLGDAFETISSSPPGHTAD